MTTPYNPALSEIPRDQLVQFIPLVPRESLLGWLESIGRVQAREDDNSLDDKMSDDLDEIIEPEIYDLEEEEEPLD